MAHATATLTIGSQTRKEERGGGARRDDNRRTAATEEDDETKVEREDDAAADDDDDVARALESIEADNNSIAARCIIVLRVSTRARGGASFALLPNSDGRRTTPQTTR